jgi:hypothetical protein
MEECELEIIWKEVVVACSRYYPETCLGVKKEKRR